MKRSVTILLVLIFVLFSGCSFWDEMKGLSVYSDFIFAFQKMWNEKNATGAWLKESATENSRKLYSVSVSDLQGKVGTYSGEVTVTYVTYGGSVNGKDGTYIFFKSDLSVQSNGKTPLSRTTSLNIDACCLTPSGLILDGLAVLKNNDPNTIATFMQAANLEGLYIRLKEPTIE